MKSYINTTKIPIINLWAIIFNLHLQSNRNINKVLALSNKRLGTPEVQLMDVAIFYNAFLWLFIIAFFCHFYISIVSSIVILQNVLYSLIFIT